MDYSELELLLLVKSKTLTITDQIQIYTSIRVKITMMYTIKKKFLIVKLKRSESATLMKVLTRYIANLNLHNN